MISYEKFRDPFLMALGLLVIFLLIFGVHYLYVLLVMTDIQMDMMNIWTYMMSAALVFSIFSTINLLLAKNTSRYYYKTVIAFAALIIIGVLLSIWISGRSILEMPTYRRVIIFVIIAFLALLSIASLIKKLEQYTKKL